MIPSKEICPYYGKEEREKWHAGRRLEDPLLRKVVAPAEQDTSKPHWEEREIERSQNLIAAVLGPEEVAKLEPGESSDRQEKERARLAAYREKNREKLAAKARERRKAK